MMRLFMGMVEYMDAARLFFTKISSVFLHGLLLSLSAHLYLSEEFSTIYAIFLILLVISRAIVIICWFIGTMSQLQPNK